MENLGYWFRDTVLGMPAAAKSVAHACCHRKGVVQSLAVLGCWMWDAGVAGLLIDISSMCCHGCCFLRAQGDIGSRSDAAGQKEYLKK